MNITRRCFISSTTIGASASAFPVSAFTGRTLSLAEIRADAELLPVLQMVSRYGEGIRMTRRGASVRVDTAIRDFDAFRETWLDAACQDTIHARGNRLAFAKGRTRFTIEHAA